MVAQPVAGRLSFYGHFSQIWHNKRMKTHSKGGASLWIIIGVVAIAALYLGGVYNGFVKGNIGVDAQWAQVESQYQRRFDLVPNVVASVQGVLK